MLNVENVQVTNKRIEIECLTFKSVEENMSEKKFNQYFKKTKQNNKQNKPKKKDRWVT